MKRQGSIAVALGLLLGGTAYAQEAQDQPQQIPGGMEQEQPAQPTQPGEPTQAPLPGAEPDVQSERQPVSGKDKSAQGMKKAKSEGVQLSALEQQQVMELQRSLQEAGYYQGEVDGVAGANTKQALSRFYRDQAQLATQGVILPRSGASLGLDEAEIERVRGEEQQPQQPQPPQQQPAQPPQQQQEQMEQEIEQQEEQMQQEIEQQEEQMQQEIEQQEEQLEEGTQPPGQEGYPGDTQEHQPETTP